MTPNAPHVVSLRSQVLWLVAVMAVFLAIRVPLMYRQPGGQDEDYYAFPGLTILENGIPRLPHVPQRDRDSAFYRADEALFTEPPLYFYWQSVAYAVLPPCYGTARMSSAIAGLGAVAMVFLLAKLLYGDPLAGLWAAAVYSLSRTFYFPATMARPDMLCGAIGLLAVWACWNWWNSDRTRWLVVTGCLIGLGGLAHPFALAYAVQIGLWVLLVSRGWRRLTRLLLVAAVAIATCAAWLPLIVRFPDVFRAQFSNQFLEAGGGSLFSRFLRPWESLATQGAVVWEHAGPLQCGLSAAGLIGATCLLRRGGPRGAATACALAWSSVILLSLCMGHHPAKGYWCYPAALVSLCVGHAVAAAWRHTDRLSLPRLVVAVPGACLIIALLIPGSGIRTWLAHVRHWNDTDYNAPAFARRIMEDLPPDDRYTVDGAYVLDFHVAGRRTLLAQTAPFYFEAQKRPYGYLILGGTGDPSRTAEIFDAELIQTVGDPENVFACRAWVYRPRGGDPD